MNKSFKRTPKNYDGQQVTTHHVGDVAPYLLRGVRASLQERPDLVLTAWPRVLGPALAAMTEAVTFSSGVLVVRVRNSTLYSLLSRRDKPRILHMLRQQLPNTKILDIAFRMS